LSFSSFCDRNIDGVPRDGTGHLPAKCFRLVFVCYFLFDARKIALRQLRVMRMCPDCFCAAALFSSTYAENNIWVSRLFGFAFCSLCCRTKHGSPGVSASADAEVARGAFSSRPRRFLAAPKNVVIPSPLRRTRNLHFLVILLGSMHARNWIVRILGAVRNAHEHGREDALSRIDNA